VLEAGRRTSLPSRIESQAHLFRVAQTADVRQQARRRPIATHVEVSTTREEGGLRKWIGKNKRHQTKANDELLPVGWSEAQRGALPTKY